VIPLAPGWMSRDYVKRIRGYAMKESMNTYYHIDAEDIKKSYLAYVLQVGNDGSSWNNVETSSEFFKILKTAQLAGCCASYFGPFRLL